MSASLDFMW